LELIDELERVLGIGAFPVNWPIGNGPEFQGIYDRQTKTMHTFERVVGGKYRAPVAVGGLHDPGSARHLSEADFNKTLEELEMLEIAGNEFDEAAVLAGKTTPVFFGSGVNNFGVQLLLDGFLKHAPAPKSRVMGGIEIAPENPAFSGFIFKIQANMDPRHRDRIAFIRVCSGKFERDMTCTHSRSRAKVRLSSSHKLFGNERETVDEAYPGDVIGLVGHDASASATRSRPIRNHLQGNPALHAGDLRLPAQSEHGEVQTIPPGPRSVACRKASSRCCTCATREQTRCSPPSVRCNSRSCSSASKANTAPSRASNPLRGTSSAGCRPR
jgi:translation elongation factor EF-G